jgi:hypothetical protein
MHAQSRACPDGARCGPGGAGAAGTVEGSVGPGGGAGPDRAAGSGRADRRADRRAGCTEPTVVKVVSTWAAERPLDLFAPMGETLAELGVAEPYPRPSIRTVTAWVAAICQLCCAPRAGIAAHAASRSWRRSAGLVLVGSLASAAPHSRGRRARSGFRACWPERYRRAARRGAVIGMPTRPHDARAVRVTIADRDLSGPWLGRWARRTP